MHGMPTSVLLDHFPGDRYEYDLSCAIDLNIKTDSWCQLQFATNFLWKFDLIVLFENNFHDAHRPA